MNLVGSLKYPISCTIVAEKNRNLVHAKETISAAILQYVEEENENDINKGEYDCVVGVSSVIQVIITSQPVPLSVIVSEISPPDTKEQDILVWIISRCIDELVNEGRLLFIYDRQRVRSRIAEMVRYFSYLKQRFEPDYSRSPGLAHMVKLSIKIRKRPKRAIPLDSGLRETCEL